MRRREGDAGAFAGVFRLGHLRLSGASRENVGRHRSSAGFDDEVKTVGEEGTKHELYVVLCGLRRDLGADVIAIALEPGGTSVHVDCIDPISGGDEIDHGGLGEKVAVALDGVAMHERVGCEWARVDVGDDEGCGDGSGLGHRRD